MNLNLDYAAVLGPRARRSDIEWELADAETARLAVSIAIERRAALSPGYPRPGRTGLRPPTGIITLWPDELVARVGAGSTVAWLDTQLQRHGLALGLDVPDPEGTSLGACYAAGRSGFAGPCGISLRDRTLGMSFVDGRARLLAGGARVVKNVAGYDFHTLHYAAHGSLGLILDLTLRLVAKPESEVAVWWPCQREELPARLPEVRAGWGQDASSEVLVDRVAAVRYGLPGPGIVFRQTGAVDMLQARTLRSGAVDVSERWSKLLARSTVAATPCPVSMLSIQEQGEDWVADLGRGTICTVAGIGGQTASPPPGAVAIKQLFDPHGIWPELPGQLRVPAELS